MVVMMMTLCAVCCAWLGWGSDGDLAQVSPSSQAEAPEDNIPSNGPKGSGEVYIERSECMYRLEIWF